MLVVTLEATYELERTEPSPDRPSDGRRRARPVLGLDATVAGPRVSVRS